MYHHFSNQQESFPILHRSSPAPLVLFRIVRIDGLPKKSFSFDPPLGDLHAFHNRKTRKKNRWFCPRATHWIASAENKPSPMMRWNWPTWPRRIFCVFSARGSWPTREISPCRCDFWIRGNRPGWWINECFPFWKRKRKTCNLIKFVTSKYSQCPWDDDVALDYSFRKWMAS